MCAIFLILYELSFLLICGIIYNRIKNLESNYEKI